MWVYDNDTVSDTFIVDLTKDRDVQDNLPCNFLNVRNDSSLIANVYLDNRKVGSVQPYSADPFIGKDFENIRIIQPDGNNFAIGDLFLQVGKNEQMSSTPYNPSWDMLEDNIDVYAAGCDSRISYSTVTPASMIKDWINFNNNKIVQRRLSVQGSASLGSYEITFDPETILSGGVPINGEILDTKQYKKTITNHEFNYSVTNAAIKGWMIDYKKDSLSINIPDITIITNPGNGLFAYDSNLITKTDYISHSLNTFKDAIELSFPECTLNSVYMQVGLIDVNSGYSALGDLRLKLNNIWTTIYDYSTGFATTLQTEDILTYTEQTLREKCTGILIRFRHGTTNSATKIRIYELGMKY